eukprot:9058628-Karenia_brevis.AAC.1
MVEGEKLRPYTTKSENTASHHAKAGTFPFNTFQDGGIASNQPHLHHNGRIDWRNGKRISTSITSARPVIDHTEFCKEQARDEKSGAAMLKSYVRR